MKKRKEEEEGRDRRKAKTKRVPLYGKLKAEDFKVRQIRNFTKI